MDHTKPSQASRGCQPSLWELASPDHNITDSHRLSGRPAVQGLSSTMESGLLSTPPGPRWPSSLPPGALVPVPLGKVELFLLHQQPSQDLNQGWGNLGVQASNHYTVPPFYNISFQQSLRWKMCRLDHEVGKGSAGALCWPLGQAESFDQVHQTRETPNQGGKLRDLL